MIEAERFRRWRKALYESCDDEWSLKLSNTMNSASNDALANSPRHGDTRKVEEPMTQPSHCISDLESYQQVLSSQKRLLDDVSFQSQLGEIHRDVVRTFQTHPFFKAGKQGETMLRNTLIALLIEFPRMGYCQGMNFVAANLILARLPANIIDMISPSSDSNNIQINSHQYDEAEADVFRLMCDLISLKSRLSMATLWSPEVPRMKLRVYQMDRLMQWNLPNLHAHFLNIQLAPEMLVSQWFLTLFSYTLPSGLTHKIWDYIFAGGWPAVFRVALSMLTVLESSFLSRDLEGIGLLMRDWKKIGQNDEFVSEDIHELVLHRADVVVVNEEVLQQLQESYAMEMISMSESSLVLKSVVVDGNSPTAASSPTNKIFSWMSTDSSDTNPSSKKLFGYTVGQSQSNVSVDEASIRASSVAIDINNPPTNWLSRYGEEIDVEVANEMIRVRDSIISMERQIDDDKHQIQTKLLKGSFIPSFQHIVHC